MTNESAKQVMDLELFGQRFTVATDAPTERVRDIVDFVNRRLETVRDASKRVQTDQIALLAALNIAEELFAERDRRRKIERSVRDRSVKLLNAIDGISKEIDLAPHGSGETGNLASSPIPLPGA